MKRPVIFILSVPLLIISIVWIIKTSQYWFIQIIGLFPLGVSLIGLFEGHYGWYKKEYKELKK